MASVIVDTVSLHPKERGGGAGRDIDLRNWSKYQRYSTIHHIGLDDGDKEISKTLVFWFKFGMAFQPKQFLVALEI
jgi:hypothetical protein